MLIDYMERHRLFAQKQITKLGSRGSEKYNMMWKELSILLNDVGTIKKTINQCKEVLIIY